MRTQEKISTPILLVDDDKIILSALKETLGRGGYRLLSAQNGAEAIELLKKQSVALIICDQRMPGLKGIDVLKEAQSIQPDAIRIILTASSDLGTVLNAINVGQVSQFIIKPWDDHSLQQTVAESLEKYRLIKENQNLHELILSQHKALTLNHEMLRHDLQMGAKIQETLLLGKIPKEVPGFVIEAMTIPSHEIDGDFFEFYRPIPQVLDIVIGDVMGKGLPAALVGTALKAQLIRFAVPFTRVHSIGKHKTWEEDLPNPEEILSYVHHEIVPSLIHLDYFVSLFYGRFNLTKQTFSFVDSGFTKPIHYQAQTKKAVQLSGGNFPLGSVAEESYHLVETTYRPGDFFIFYSDGVSETMSPTHEQYGSERLIQIAKEFPEADPATLISIIKESVTTFSQKESFNDDLTIIVIKVTHLDAELLLRHNVGKFFADLSQLKAVREFVNRICSQAPVGSKQIVSELQLAINELFCNIVIHGYKDRKDGIISIQIQIEPEGINVDISDQGSIFEPKQIQEPSLAGDKSNGFGWYIIREVIDTITYRPKQSKEGWNHLHFFKKYVHKGKEMHFLHTIQDKVLIITPDGESLDAKDAPELKEKLNALFKSIQMRDVVLDLSHVQFIDSSGLGVFLSILRVLHSQGGELKLACLNKAVRTMFELVSMHKIFEIYNSTDEAVRSFKQ